MYRWVWKNKLIGDEEARGMRRQERESVSLLEIKACERERWMEWNSVGAANLMWWHMEEVEKILSASSFNLY